MLSQTAGRRLQSWRSLLNSTLDIFESYCLNNWKWLLWVGLIVYVAIRIAVFWLMIEGDVKFYAQYGYEARAAYFENSTIYRKFYFDHDINRTIEYPPLAIGLFLLISLAIPTNLDSAQFYIAFNRVFHGLLFAADLGFFAILLRYLFSRKVKVTAIVASAVTYTLTGFILGHFLYSRLDLILGQLIFGAIFLMNSRERLEIASVAVLSFAIAFKLVPILLLPIWLIKGLSQKAHNGFRIACELAKRGVLFASIIGLPWVVFWFLFGQDSLSFLDVHRLRGIHLESLWGNLALILSKFGVFAVNLKSFRSIDVEFPWSSFFETMSLAFLLFGCLSVYVIYGRKYFRLVRTKPVLSAANCQEKAELFTLAALSCLVLSVAVSKVLSPQYLLWFVPFALMVPWELTWGKFSQLILLSLACLTTLIVPLFYVSDVLAMTWFGVVLLSLRNIGLVVWAGILLFNLARYRNDAEHVVIR